MSFFTLVAFLIVGAGAQSLSSSGCTIQGTVVSCTGRRLATLPSNICSATTTLLDLSSNRLTSLAGRPFRNCPMLEGIFLQNNMLSWLDKRAFEGLTNLKRLYLHGNLLSSLNSTVFRGLSSIVVITLHANRLESLPSDVFSSLSTLERLYLYNNQLTELDPPLFKNLTNLRRLSALKNQIRRLEAGTFENSVKLRELYLQENAIETIEIGAFRNLSSLLHLHLESNRLTETFVGMFLGLYNLKVLHLEDNSIRRVRDRTFRDIPNIQRLYLSSNALTEVTVFTFTELELIETLDLSSNMIQVFQDGALYRQRTLKTLLLDSNAFTKLTTGMFLNLYNLELLNLASNSIKVLPRGVFHPLENLKTLSLYGNEIRNVSCDSLLGLDKLTSLNLGYNEINWIAEGAFSHVPSLTYLHLYHNELRVLTEQMFKGLKKLFHLSLQCNPIEYIAEGAFNSLKSLKELVYVGSQCPSFLPCDCNSLWLKNWLQTKTKSMRDFNTIISCTAQTQTMIAQVPASEFTCNRNPEVVVTTSADVVRAGGEVTLTCTSTPAARYRWIKAGETFESGSAGFSPHHGVLVVENFDTKKAGTYVCVAETVKWSTAASVRVDVARAPTFDGRMGDVELAGPGGAAVFFCNPSGLPTPSVTWMRNGRRVRESSRIEFVGNYLVVNDATSSDAGDYRCVAKNDFGQRKQSASLRIAGGCAPRCRNGGTCEAMSVFACECAPGFGGSYCQERTFEPVDLVSGSGDPTTEIPEETTTTTTPSVKVPRPTATRRVHDPSTRISVRNDVTNGPTNGNIVPGNGDNEARDAAQEPNVKPPEGG